MADRLRGTAFGEDVARLAEQVRRRRLPLLGFDGVDLGREIRWRRDFLSGIETGTEYFRLIPYLEPARVGDHKAIWELNRHQHLVLLAQSFRLHGNSEDLAEIVRQLESWIAENPFQRGINWVSALEVAFRALSWIWIEHLVGEGFHASFRARFLEVLYRHGAYLEQNLSVYFSPNTHLLGEAVALHALGKLFPSFPGAEQWRRKGAGLTAAQMFAQVHCDGSHFEQSTYYHVYALDMFAFHAVLEPPSAEYRARLGLMAEYLEALLGPSGELAFFGDDDGGRFFHPFGKRSRFGNASLATCGVLLNRPEWIRCAAAVAEQAAWWLPAHPVSDSLVPAARSRHFEQAGMAVLASDRLHVLFDGGPFGVARAGHSHSDTLSIVVRSGQEEILIDPATYSYMDIEWRNRFRGSAAHNTIRIDGRDQAIPVSPFAWSNHPEVRWHEWRTAENTTLADAECAYAGFTHRRKLVLIKSDFLFVVDEICGPPGDHIIEQFWHLGAAAGHVVVSGEVEHLEMGPIAWRSDALLSKRPSPVLRVVRRGVLPMRLAAAILPDNETGCGILMTAGGAEFRPEGQARCWKVEFAGEDRICDCGV